MAVSVHFGKELPQRAPIEIDTSTPFRVLVLADLGTEKNWGKPKFVDCDDLKPVMKELGIQVKLRLSADGPVAEVPISEMDDFHPDQLFRNMDLFRALRDQRQRVANSDTFAQEIAASQQVSESETGNEQAAGASLLDAAVEQAQARQIPLEQQVVQGTVDWDAYVRQLVSPYLVKKADPQQAEMLMQVDDSIAESLRRVLHHERFQQVEATWRGIHLLTDRLDTGRTLQIAVLNVSQAALSEDLANADALEKSKLYQLLVEQPQEEQESPWNFVIGDYYFNSSAEQTAELGRIAKVCSAAGSTFVAGAASEIAGCPGFDQAPDADDWSKPSEEELKTWDELRSLPEANRLALTLPRVLCRRPYGKESDPIDSFAFEEIPKGNHHSQYLWMNAAFAVGYLQAEEFLAEGWQSTSVRNGKFKRLPVYLFINDDGEECIMPCAEANLVDRSAEKLADYGLTVTRSVRDEGEVRFVAVRSLSSDDPQLRLG